MGVSRFRWIRPVVYISAAVAAAGVLASSALGSDSFSRTLVNARQLAGLWALALLLGSMSLGPVTRIAPWLPWKSELIYARRAIGVCSALFAMLHVLCYLGSLMIHGWREIYKPGAVWMIGLVLGFASALAMSTLTLTSTDAAVKRLGGRRWKRIHRGVYAALALTLLHAFFNGADFGWHRAPDVAGEPDAGAGVTFLCLSVVWLILFVLRRSGWKLGLPTRE